MKGTFWSDEQLAVNFVATEQLLSLVGRIQELLLPTKSKPVLISGERGVGKSTLINLVARVMKLEGVDALIATATNLKAGNQYIGQLEGVVEDLVYDLKESELLWIAPSFLQLYYAGKHSNNPSGILDMITPTLAKGEIKLIGELTDTDLEKLLSLQPEVQNIFEIFRITPASQQETLALAKQWMEKDDYPEKWQLISEDQLEELFFISRQYLSYQENPGALVDFFTYTKNKFRRHPEPLVIENFYDALSSQTGLPISILNDHQKLDLDLLRSHFNGKVVGQEEAVNVLVERIAMIKAGLTDPSKPFGVFLFVGPTGTGKTEITKVLAEYLFSSPSRMIRLDMSEFQSADSYTKIFGNYGMIHNSTSLVNEIRKNPFSVILLDEFEKAHPQIWDLFLQIFDDGRLSDSQGSSVDFRQSIIIMTSNIGAIMPTFQPERRLVGFGNEQEQEEDAEVYDPKDYVNFAVNETFRPEFVNRIDKIVVFNPLSRAALGKILDIELKKILQRRGLRNKKWALDMEDSATEFLLEKGFTQNLGARPLKRAIEQYLLAPLATTIVNHNFPKGDQFLLVSKGKQDKLKVRFIDPDEPQYTWEEKLKLQQHQEQKSKSLDLKTILRDCYGSLAEFTCIKQYFAQLQQAYYDAGIEDRKEEMMNAMAQPDFWQSTEKQEVLSHIEYYDRFAAAFDTTETLLTRLEDPDKVRLNYDPSLLKKLAQKIYLLQASITSYQQLEPQDALLKISFAAQHSAWGERIVQMYLDWARRRKMLVKKVQTGEEPGQHFSLFHFSGFGCYTILKQENGIHLKERKPAKSKMVEKSRVRVGVLPLDSSEYSLLETPLQLLDKFRDQPQASVVRRFNMDSKQCKDSVNKWQTGNMDKILKGMFDVMG
jgi:ATP-dependent Clp protease ATP-binding subunit ClpC